MGKEKAVWTWSHFIGVYSPTMNTHGHTWLLLLVNDLLVLIRPLPRFLIVANKNHVTLHYRRLIAIRQCVHSCANVRVESCQHVDPGVNIYGILMEHLHLLKSMVNVQERNYIFCLLLLVFCGPLHYTFLLWIVYTMTNRWKQNTAIN